MRDHFIKSTIFFQDLLWSYFQRITSQVVERSSCSASVISLALQSESSRRCLETPESKALSGDWVSESLSCEVFESATRVCDGT